MPKAEPGHSSRSPVRTIGMVAGPLLALVILLFFDLSPGKPMVTRTAAVAVLMAVWWLTEAIPIPVTALLPMALFPALGVMKGKAVAGTYFNSVIFLFIGGFIMALAMQKWNLHRRIALRVLLFTGGRPRRIVLGFMLVTAFLSMWISNTATTMMMVPIALAVIAKVKEHDEAGQMPRFPVGLLIGVAYAASIGGVATLIGTPPNLAFMQIYAISFPAAPEISFARWLLFGFPVSVVFLAIAWVLLTALFVPRTVSMGVDTGFLKEEYRRLGAMSYEEKTVSVLFALMAVLWLFRQPIVFGSLTIPGWSALMPEPAFIDDGVIAIAVSLLLFLIPSRRVPGSRLIDWQTASRLRWGIVILFGGGFALAAGFKESGLSVWAAGQLAGLAGTPPVGLVAAVCTLLTFLTELTSNAATTQMVLPLLASLATSIHVHPLLLMIPATLSASCAFMLPIATPPNAIIFGSGEIRMADMVRVGFLMNLIGIVLITAMIYILGLAVFGIHPGQVPSWAGV